MFRNRSVYWWIGVGCLAAALVYSVVGDTAHQALWTAFAALAGFWELEGRMNG